MPFYLVTQTSLVEAQDEQEAAQHSVERLRSGAPVTVVVKADETTITHVVVPAKIPQPISATPGGTANKALTAVAIEDPPYTPPESKWMFLRRMFVDALSVLGRKT